VTIGKTNALFIRHSGLDPESIFDHGS
jgi:hypothetical protein